MEIDGKQSISELGKQEMAAHEYRQELKQIKEEQEALEKQAKNIDKIRERYDKLTAQVKELEATGKTTGKQYEKTVVQLGKVSENLRQAEQATKDLASSQAKYKATADKLDQTNLKIKDLRKEMGLAGMTMGQLRNLQRDLALQMDKGVTKGTERYEQLKREIQEVNGAIRAQRSDVNGTTSAWSKIKTEIKSFGIMALGYLGAQEIIGRIGNMVRGSADLADALSDVQKTSGLTKKETLELSSALGDINTRTARKELLGMAEIAGRLGIKGKKDIEGFVKAADQINIALGDSLGDVETVMRDLGKLTGTYNIQSIYGIEESLLRVGSAINELGMASTANEGNIVDFTRRMGGIAPLAKISIQDIMGMGAALDALGQTSETSSTALSKLFIKMASNAKEYARFAKMEVQDFVELMNTDANEAFLRVLNGVRDNSEGITDLAITLGDLGEDGGRVVGVLGTLANKVDFLRQQQDLSNKTFQEGNSVADEAKIRNENLAASLAKVQRAFNSWFINTDFMKFMESSLGVMAKWIAVPISETMEKDRASMNLLFRQIIDTNTKTEDRIKLINEMKSIYPDLLGNINAETVSNDELTKSIRRVNDQLINKIILQKEDEEISEQLERQGKLTKTQKEAELELMRNMQKVAEKYNLEIDNSLPLIDAASKLANEAGTQMNLFEVLNSKNSAQKLFDDINTLKGLTTAVKEEEQQTNILLEEREDLLKHLGMSVNSDFVKGAGQASRAGALGNSGNQESSPSTSIIPGDKELDKVMEKFKDFQQSVKDLEASAELDRLDKDSKEIAQIEKKFQALREKALSYYNQGYLDKETYDQTIAQLNLLQDEYQDRAIDEQNEKLKEKRQAFQEEIEMMSLDEQEREVEQTNRKFESLIAQANEYGLDTVELEEIRRQTIEEINRKYDERLVQQKNQTNQRQLKADVELRQAQIDITLEYSRIAADAINLVGKKGGELTAFQKVLALAQIGIDTGAAIMKAELVALQAASAGGPAAPAIYTATKVAIIGSILSAVVRAKDLFTNSNIPDFGTSTGETTKGEGRANRYQSDSKKSYYFGGPTGNGLGYGDQYGEYAGYVHRHEYVIPQAVRKEPIVQMQIEPILESLRMKAFSGRSFFAGGETSSSHSADNPKISFSADASETNRLLKVMIKQLETFPRELKGKWVYSDLEEMEKEMQELKSRYRA